MVLMQHHHLTRQRSWTFTRRHGSPSDSLSAITKGLKSPTIDNSHGTPVNVCHKHIDTP
jgi:hypothetical protein